MKTRKGEPVIVVPEEQQQIVELERQLAEANTRIETLTRRLEAAEERAEAWEEAALRKAGKAEYDWMEKNRRYNIERAEKAEVDADHYRNACIQTERNVQQILGQALGYPWCKDAPNIFPGSTEADGVFVGEHTAETLATEIAERLKQIEAELRRWRGCPSCKEDHDDSVMCPPHEVRTSGRAWFYTQARKWAARTEEVEAQLAAIDRILEEGEITTVGASFANTADAIRETIVALRQVEAERNLLLEANEFIKNEAAEWRAERDQLAVECGLLREALERLEGYHTAYVIGYHIAMDKPVKRLEDIEWHEAELQAREALSSTPHADKAAERMANIRMYIETAISKLTMAGSGEQYDPSWMRPKTLSKVEVSESAIQAYHWMHKALDALDKPEVQDALDATSGDSDATQR